MYNCTCMCIPMIKHEGRWLPCAATWLVEPGKSSLLIGRKILKPLSQPPIDCICLILSTSRCLCKGFASQTLEIYTFISKLWGWYVWALICKALLWFPTQNNNSKYLSGAQTCCKFLYWTILSPFCLLDFRTLIVKYNTAWCLKHILQKWTCCTHWLTGKNCHWNTLRCCLWSFSNQIPIKYKFLPGIAGLGHNNN